MGIDPTELRMVNDHIAQGERHVARQIELIAWLKERGHPIEMAEELLRAFRSTLHQHRQHRDQMMIECEPNPLQPIAAQRVALRDDRGPSAR